MFATGHFRQSSSIKQRGSKDYHIHEQQETSEGHFVEKFDGGLSWYM